MTKTIELFIVTITLFVLTILFGIVGNMENNYSIDAKVKRYSNGVITFCDITDNLWEYEITDTDVKEGDNVTLYFSTNGTDETRLDDEITSFSIKR